MPDRNFFVIDGRSNRRDETAELFTFGNYAPGVYGSQTVYSNLQSGTPKPVSNLNQIQKIRSGSGSQGFCALDANAAIWCWGRGDSGQLGNGASLSSHVPVKGNPVMLAGA